MGRPAGSPGWAHGYFLDSPDNPYAEKGDAHTRKAIVDTFQELRLHELAAEARIDMVKAHAIAAVLESWKDHNAFSPMDCGSFRLNVGSTGPEDAQSCRVLDGNQSIPFLMEGLLSENWLLHVNCLIMLTNKMDSGWHGLPIHLNDDKFSAVHSWLTWYDGAYRHGSPEVRIVEGEVTEVPSHDGILWIGIRCAPGSTSYEGDMLEVRRDDRVGVVVVQWPRPAGEVTTASILEGPRGRLDQSLWRGGHVRFLGNKFATADSANAK